MRSTGRLLLSVVAVAWVAGCTGRDGVIDPDWPMFHRDIERSGVTSAPAIEEPVVLWERWIGIQGYLNNPVIAGDRVYVGSSGYLHNASDGADGVYCLEKSSGEIVWHAATRTDACGVAYQGGRVFATSDDRRIRAIDAKSGDELWSEELSGQLYSQPLLLGETVIIGGPEGGVWCFEQDRGRIAWCRTITENKPSVTVRGGLCSDGKRVFAAFVDGTVAALTTDGDVVWSRQLEFLKRDAVYGVPTVIGDRLIIGFARDTYFDEPALLAMDKMTGAVLWRETPPLPGTAREGRFGNVRSSVVPYGDFLLYGEPYSNELTAIDARTGAFGWSAGMGAPMFWHWPSPAIAGDMLYLARHDGALHAVDLDRREARWLLYLGDHERISRELPEGILPEGSGCEWDPGVGWPIYASPAVSKSGVVVVGTGEGFLYAVVEKRPEGSGTTP